MTVNRTSSIPFMPLCRHHNRLVGHQKCPPKPQRRRGPALRANQTGEQLRSDAHVEARKRRHKRNAERDPMWAVLREQRIRENRERRAAEAAALQEEQQRRQQALEAAAAASRRVEEAMNSSADLTAEKAVEPPAHAPQAPKARKQKAPKMK